MIQRTPNDQFYRGDNGEEMSKWDFWYSITSSVLVTVFMVIASIAGLASNQTLMQYSLLMAILLTLIKIEFNQ